MNLGSKFVLFLTSWEFADLPYTLLNPSQSSYYYEFDIIDEYMDMELESVSDENDIVLTVSDLHEIAEYNELQE